MSQFFAWCKAILISIVLLAIITILPLLISALGVALCIGALAVLCKLAIDEDNLRK